MTTSKFLFNLADAMPSKPTCYNSHLNYENSTNREPGDNDNDNPRRCIVSRNGERHRTRTLPQAHSSNSRGEFTGSSVIQAMQSSGFASGGLKR